MPSPAPDDSPYAGQTGVYRALAAGGGLAVLAYGVAYARVVPGAVDPWWARGGLAVACGVFAAVPWKRDRRPFRWALYALVSLITAWVIYLLWLNRFSGAYDIGLLMIVSLVGGVIRSPRALAVYGIVTVAGVAGVAVVTPAPALNPLLFLSKVVTVLVVFLALAHGRRRTARELAASEARYRQLFDASPRPLWVCDAVTLRPLAVNDAALAQYGYTRAAFLAATMRDLRAPGEAASEAALAAPAATAAPEADGAAEADRLLANGVWRHRRHDGSELDVAIASHALSWDGRPARLVLATDVTAQLRLEAELTRQALHDPLTALANRTLFRQRVAEALARRAANGPGRREGGLIAVLFLDLDDFKTVNDSLGHGAGDALLVSVARRLLHATRGCDTVARLGGDEFAVLVDEIRDPEEAIAVAHRVLVAMEQPLLVDGTEARTHASIGIATSAPVADGPEASAEALLRDADTAMYRAKALGKGRACLFEPAMHTDALLRLQLQAELRRAVAVLGTSGTGSAGSGSGGLGSAGAFHLVYQPIVSLATHTVLGVEALVRWTHPVRGALSPAAFVPLAEETGLIVPLGRWVLATACTQAAAWRRVHPAAAALRVSVNVAERQLRDPHLVDDVRGALAASGLPPEALVLEITESALVQDPARARRTLDAIAALGVRIALDDFGTGYSSLSYLRQFPVHILKIDRAFVSAMTAPDATAGDRPDAGTTLVQAIVQLSEMLGLESVAEGIEDAEQAAMLRRFGCALGQGFHFARPLDPDALAARLEAARDTRAA